MVVRFGGVLGGPDIVRKKIPKFAILIHDSGGQYIVTPLAAMSGVQLSL
jgi:hypothetical protein